MCYASGDSTNILLGYDEISNSFYHKSKSSINVTAADFIQLLKDANKSKANRNKKVSSNIKNYEKALSLSKKMKYLYIKGEVHDNGRKVTEDVYLINNPKYWYGLGGAMSTIIIWEYIFGIYSFIELFSENQDEEYEHDPFYDEEEEREKKKKEYRLYNEIGRKTFIPGLIILSVAYIGNKIKIGQEEIIINESDILLPKISDYFSRVEIQNAIGIYNWAKRNDY